jgi:hypothetical protein
MDGSLGFQFRFRDIDASARLDEDFAIVLHCEVVVVEALTERATILAATSITDKRG